jgi:hypothetical protein
MIRRLPLIVLALLLVPTGADATPEVLEARKQAAAQQLIADLEALAKWCKTPKLFGKRDETYELILDFDTDHAQARRALDYRRDAAGAWTQSDRYKRPRNWTPKAIARYDDRLAEAFATYRDAVLRTCATARERRDLTWAADAALALLARFDADPQVLDGLKAILLRHLALLEGAEVPVELERVTGHLNRLYPKDPTVRKALGEVEVEGRWLLPATALSVTVRKRLAEAAKAALEGVPQVTRGKLTPEEEAVGLGWATVYESEHMRVLGTTTDASLLEIARSCEAAGPFFEAVFGRTPQRPKTYTFYVFTKLEHWQRFAERFAGIEEVQREAARAATGSGFPISSTAYGVLPVGRAATERDLCVDVLFQTLLYQTFSQWHADTQTFEELPGWVRIGLSDYLTYRLIGTRILTTVGGEYARPLDDPKGRSPKKRSGWLTQAREILQRTQAPGTRMMLGKTLGAFNGDDAITSFAFASYLLEGVPERVPTLLAQVGTGARVADVVAEVLGQSVEALHVQWVRWLEETSAED